ncbi:MAG TPA: hypothetical protein VN914_08720 [Polyangia bacterium]|nr:hypothetical protein [Polyangia bacterium]
MIAGLQRFTLRLVVRGLVVVASLLGDDRLEGDEPVDDLAPATTAS